MRRVRREMLATVWGMPMKWFLSVCTLLFVLSTWPAGADAAGQISDFYGKYVGSAAAKNDGEMQPRHLDVEIRPKDKGFIVSWTTIITKKDAPPRADSQTIFFREARRVGVFASAMKRSMFGELVPLDPLAGDPYFWAAIDGQTLSVYALIILDNRTYELQQYDRTLTEDGLDLRFIRIRNGEKLREIAAHLKRVAE